MDDNLKKNIQSLHDLGDKMRQLGDEVKVAKSKLSGNAPKEVDERIAFCEEVLQLLQDLLPEMIEDMKAKDIEGYVEKTKKVHTLARLISATSEEIRNYCETGEFSGKTTIH